MSEYVQITTTTDTKDLAQRIAQDLVKNRLAACVQITGPISSIYEWKGKIENTEEYLCMIKTRKEFFQQVESYIKSLHTYEVPEIVAIPIWDGSQDYLKWIDDSVKPA